MCWGGEAGHLLPEHVLLEPVTPSLSPCPHPSNVDQWVGVYIEYKFQAPISTHLQGLANHLAQNIMDPAVQKSSITANGESGPGSLCVFGLQPLTLSGSQCSSSGEWTEFHINHKFLCAGATERNWM